MKITKIAFLLALTAGITGGAAAYAADSQASLSNPYVSYQTYGQVARAVGFHPLYLSSLAGYRATDFLTISGDTADLRYTKGESVLTVRTANDAADDEDISGVYTGRWVRKKINNTDIYTARTGNNSFAAHWTSGGYAFSAVGENMTEEEFMRLVSGGLIEMTENWFTVSTGRKTASLK